MIPLGLVLNRYTLAAGAFALYSAWLFTQGRQYEHNLQARAVVALNTKLEDINRKETKVFIKDLALRTKAHADAKPVLAQSGPCTVTEEEAIALSRIK